MKKFQSTPPVWAETVFRKLVTGERVFQSTPPVWAETCRPSGARKRSKISIHSARVGGDVINKALRRVAEGNFNPLRPCGRRLEFAWLIAQSLKISIHSARVGGDAKRPYHRSISAYFNPLRPCGRRLAGAVVPRQLGCISIHSARVGGDLSLSISSGVPIDFNPLRPCGRRQGLWGNGCQR